MNEDHLKKMLQDADERAGTPTVPTDLAARIRRHAARRRGRLVGGLSAAAAVILVGFCLWKWQEIVKTQPSDIDHDNVFVKVNGGGHEVISEQGTEPQAVRTASAVLTEIERLNREAEFQTALVREVTRSICTESQLIANREKIAALPDAVANARREADEAAYVMVAHADRMCRELHACASAAERYRWVTEYFPDSCWATVARQRLAELKEKGEIS